MKKIASAVLVMISVLCLFVFTACEKNGSDRYTIDELEISDIKVIQVEENYFNLNIGVKNPTSQDKECDLSKIRLMLDDKIEVPHFAGKKNCQADRYNSYAFMISDDHPDMKLGDSVTVYYADDKICTIRITELK